MWSHFVPAHDKWFDPWVKDWGTKVGVNVTIDHVNYADLPATTQAEIQADVAGDRPRRGRRHLLHPGAARACGRQGREPRRAQLDRPELRQEPGRGQGVPAALHRQQRPGGLELQALRLPRVREGRASLNDWLTNDPFKAKPADKLALLEKATDWSTNVGHPGPANTAEGEVFATFVIPNMFAKAARGQATPSRRWPRPRRRSSRSSTSGVNED